MSVKVELEGTESFQPLKALQKMRSRILIQNPTKMQSRQKVIKTFSFPQTNFYGEKVDVILQRYAGFSPLQFLSFVVARTPVWHTGYETRQSGGRDSWREKDSLALPDNRRSPPTDLSGEI